MVFIKVLIILHVSSASMILSKNPDLLMNLILPKIGDCPPLHTKYLSLLENGVYSYSVFYGKKVSERKFQKYLELKEKFCKE